MITFDSEKTASFVFIGKSGYAVQEKIAGAKLANDVQIEESIPSGSGTFYLPEQHAVTPPVTINYSSNKDTERYFGKDNFGKDIEIVKHPAVKVASIIEDGRYAIPTNAKFT